MSRILLLLTLLSPLATRAQIAPFGFLEKSFNLEATITPDQFTALKTAVAGLTGRYRSVKAPCDQLVTYGAKAESADASATTWIKVTEHLFPLDVTTGTGTIRLRFPGSALGASCEQQIVDHRSDAFGFAHIELGGG